MNKTKICDKDNENITLYLSNISLQKIKKKNEIK